MFDKTSSIIPRQDDLDGVSPQVKIKEEIEGIKKENEALRYIASKYNNILIEYQKKYGNDLYLEIDKVLTNNDNPNVPNYSVLNKSDIVSLKKKLIENIAVFKEYEKGVSDRDTKVSALELELQRIQNEMEDVINENEELKNRNEQLKEDKANLYKQILDKDNINNDNIVVDSNNINNNINANANVNADDDIIIEEDTPNENKQNYNSSSNNTLTNEDTTTLLKENDKLLSQLNSLRLKANQYEQRYNALQNKHNFTSSQFKNKDEYDNINYYKEENDTLIQQLNHLQNQLQQKTLEIIKLEKEQTRDKVNADKLESENNVYKKENFSFKTIYDELEYTKNSQITSLTTENTELKGELSTLKQQIKLKEDKISDQTFQLNQLKQEHNIMKSDLDNLTQVIEDSNTSIQTASEKEQHVNDIIKNIKKKIDDTYIEKDSINNKIRLQENEITKLTNEYANIVKEKSNAYDTMLSTAKKKYDEIIKSKNDEIAQIKKDIITIRLERDRYLNECKLLQSEVDKIKNNFYSDNGNYINKYEEAQKTYNMSVSNYENQIVMLQVRKDKLEMENQNCLKELNSFRVSQQIKENQFKDKTKNESELIRQIESDNYKMDFSKKENDSLNQEKQQQLNTYQNKLKNIKEEKELQITVLENTIKQQKEQLSLIEERAFDMLKKQEHLTEKFKKEYLNTIDYYEGLIAYLTGGNTVQGIASAGTEEQVK